MAILRYENMTHAELSGLPRDKTVVFICTGPLEQHGPHLPLGTDALTAEFFSTQVAQRLAARFGDWNYLLFPTFFAGSDTLTYTGTVEVRPATLRALLMDCCKQLARDGFRTIVLFSTHGGPRHMVVLEEVAEKLRWRYRARAISASSRILHEVMKGGLIERISEAMEKSGQALSAAERDGLKNDYHGGLLETSLMLVARPDLVRPVFKTLEPAIVDKYWKLRRNSGKKVGAGLGHLGTPALARLEIGQAAVQVVLDDTAPLLERFLAGENVNKLFRSRFYFIPIFRTDFKVMAMMLVYPIIIFMTWVLLSRSLVGMLK